MKRTKGIVFIGHTYQYKEEEEKKEKRSPLEKYINKSKSKKSSANEPKIITHPENYISRLHI
jgi:hypothetical protein